MEDRRDKFYTTRVPIVSDPELAEELNQWFLENPKIKKQWWYREALEEKLQRERKLGSV